MKKLSGNSPESNSVIAKLKPILFVTFAFVLGIGTAQAKCPNAGLGFKLSSVSIEGTHDKGDIVSCSYDSVHIAGFTRTIKSSDFVRQPITVTPNAPEGSPQEPWSVSENNPYSLMCDPDSWSCAFIGRDVSPDQNPVRIFPFSEFPSTPEFIKG